MTARLELVSDSRSHELALVRRAASGDEVAFEQIYRDHAPRVFALCCRMTGSRERAAECVQDVFVQVWRRLADWRGDAALGTWIHRVTVNRVLSNVRTEQRRLIHEMPDSPEREPSPRSFVSRPTTVGWTWSAPSPVCQPAPVPYSCCTTWRDTGTRKSPA
jgi:DNA-directed RNA polymerase specialized sigma24 family protein